MKSVKALATVLLILGIPTMSFLTFFVAVSFLLSIFSSPPLWQQIAGYVSLAGPIPLIAGAILLFFPGTRVLGARLALAGGLILSVYMVVCYSRLYIYSVRLPERLLWFGIVPMAVLAVDYTSYRAYLAVKEHKGHGSAASS